MKMAFESEKFTFFYDEDNNEIKLQIEPCNRAEFVAALNEMISIAFKNRVLTLYSKDSPPPIFRESDKTGNPIAKTDSSIYER